MASKYVKWWCRHIFFKYFYCNMQKNTKKQFIDYQGISQWRSLLPHFWKARLSISRANFLPAFQRKFRRRKKHNTLDRFLVENKWTYEKLKTKSAEVDPPMYYPQLKHIHVHRAYVSMKLCDYPM